MVKDNLIKLNIYGYVFMNIA